MRLGMSHVRQFQRKNYNFIQGYSYMILENIPFERDISPDPLIYKSAYYFILPLTINICLCGCSPPFSHLRTLLWIHAWINKKLIRTTSSIIKIIIVFLTERNFQTLFWTQYCVLSNNSINGNYWFIKIV